MEIWKCNLNVKTIPLKTKYLSQNIQSKLFLKFLPHSMRHLQEAKLFIHRVKKVSIGFPGGFLLFNSFSKHYE
jgi:hypothetical protein